MRSTFRKKSHHESKELQYRRLSKKKALDASGFVTYSRAGIGDPAGERVTGDARDRFEVPPAACPCTQRRARSTSAQAVAFVAQPAHCRPRRHNSRHLLIALMFEDFSWIHRTYYCVVIFPCLFCSRFFTTPLVFGFDAILINPFSWYK